MIPTFRHYLETADLERVYELLRERHALLASGDSTPGYRKVITSMLAMPPSPPPDANPITVEAYEELGEHYHHVSLRNVSFVEPPAGLKPWGCNKGEAPPEGHYDANADCYAPAFAIGFCPRAELVDRPVVVEPEALAPERVLAEILWEITFYGFDDAQVESTFRRLEEDVEASVEAQAVAGGGTEADGGTAVAGDDPPDDIGYL
jgi:hypothetical protein